MLTVNPITGTLQNYGLANYDSVDPPNSGKRPLLGELEDGGKLRDRIESLRDIQVGFKSERQIQQQNTVHLRKNNGHSLAELLKNMQIYKESDLASPER